MFKKFTIITALSAALVAGGAHQASAAAADEAQSQQPYKVYYSINGFWKQFSLDQKNDLKKNYGYWYNQNKQQETMKPEQEKEQPKQEQTQEDEKEETVQPEAKEQVKEEATAPKEEQTQQKQEEQNNESQVQSDQLNAFEQEVVELTNKERANNGLAPLKVDGELSKVAREKSRDMSANSYFSHNSPNYGSPFDMMQSYGINYRTAGENIAKGQRTPQEVVNAWMNSDGHRANILNADFTHIGVGYVEQGSHWTQQFIGK